jgi:prepilin-type N-terminal cleavage/methylation domain-containing protein
VGRLVRESRESSLGLTVARVGGVFSVGDKGIGPGEAARCRFGFTLVEMLVVLAIIAVLASLSYPAVIHDSRTFQLIKCLSQGKRLGQATTLYFQNGGGKATSAQGWISTLEPYGMKRSMWICPTRKVDMDHLSPSESDFFYAGARPEEIRLGNRIGELYLWVERYPYHDGMHVCVMGDGRARAENLLKVDY